MLGAELSIYKVSGYLLIVSLPLVHKASNNIYHIHIMDIFGNTHLHDIYRRDQRHKIKVLKCQSYKVSKYGSKYNTKKT